MKHCLAKHVWHAEICDSKSISEGRNGQRAEQGEATWQIPRGSSVLRPVLLKLQVRVITGGA